jgi:uroporphyrinogen decarboxylase
MTPKERFYATIERREVDRPASWMGMPVTEANENLFKYFNVSNIKELKQKLGDDIFPIDLPYNNPPSNHIACAFDFEKGDDNDYEERTLTAPGIFEDCSDPVSINEYKWPDPSEHIDTEECSKAVAEAPEDCAVMGVVWSAHFQDACSAFGMETALMKMITEPDMFRAVIDRITDFYLDANEIFYSATKGKLDAVLMGNDFGSQTSLMLSPDAIREFILPGTRSLVSQAKSYGLKVIHHSCGSVYEIIPDLIDAGVDAIHPIQALASKMEPERLKRDFGEKMSFCGGVDAQELLVNGKPEQIQEKVSQLMKIFPTGLIVSPSHEAVLQDIAPENIEAIFNTLRGI